MIRRDAALEASGAVAREPAVRAFGGVSGGGEVVSGVGKGGGVFEEAVRPTPFEG
jgi:hypothetical protein